MRPVHQRMLVPWVNRNLWQECLVSHQPPGCSVVQRGRLSPVTGSKTKRGSVETSGRHLFRRAAMTSRNLLCLHE